MAKSLNRATLIGNLGADPEVRTTPQGSLVCTLKIATNENYKDRNGEWQESTEWHTVVLWERLAEVAQKYLSKGKKVYIEGKIQTRTYEKDGSTRYFTEIRGLNLILLDRREDEAPGEATGSSYKEDYASPSKVSDSPVADNDDEDVPF